MKRRAFITLLGGAAAVWPLAAHAQQSVMPVIGILASVSPAPYARFIEAIKQGLREAGYVEGRNVAIEYRWADGQYDRLPQLATELVDRSVAVALEAKRLQLLHELVPSAAVVAIIVNPKNPQADQQLQELQAAARTLGVQVEAFKAGTPNEIDTAFANAVQRRAGALHMAGDAFFNTRKEQFVVLSARHVLPTGFSLREFPAAGGLMSYGPSLADAYRQQGIYAGRILKGEKPAEMPVEQAVKVELVINVQTAKTLGLNIPLPLLGRADEVIE